MQAILDFKVDANPLLQALPICGRDSRSLRRFSPSRPLCSFRRRRALVRIALLEIVALLAAASSMPQALPVGTYHPLQAPPRRIAVESVRAAKGAAALHSSPVEGHLPISRRLVRGRRGALRYSSPNHYRFWHLRRRWSLWWRDCFRQWRRGRSARAFNAVLTAWAVAGERRNSRNTRGD